MKTIEATAEDIERHEALTELLQLQDLSVVGQERDDVNDIVLVICIPRWPVAVCRECGQLCAKAHDYPKQRTIHDTPIRGQATRLVFDSRRFACECGTVFTETIRDVVPDCTYTYRLMEELTNPRRKQDVATLAETYGLGYKLVEGILLKAAEEKVEARRHAPIQVKHLGIDEISSAKGQGHYYLVLTDLEGRQLLDVLENRHKETLVDWLQEPPTGIDLSQLEQVAIDLWAHYRDAVQSVYPHVSIVADRFHVMQNLNDVIHRTRRQLQKEAVSDEERSQLKGLRYPLVKNQAKLTESERARIEQLELSHPQLHQLWLLRQELHDWYATKTEPELARTDLHQWIVRASTLDLPALDTFCNTLTTWQDQIVNFFPSPHNQRFRGGHERQDPPAQTHRFRHSQLSPF